MCSYYINKLTCRTLVLAPIDKDIQNTLFYFLLLCIFISIKNIFFKLYIFLISTDRESVFEWRCSEHTWKHYIYQEIDLNNTCRQLVSSAVKKIHKRVMYYTEISCSIWIWWEDKDVWCATNKKMNKTNTHQ